MNEKARKYVDLFRSVKIASAATVDESGHPRTRIVNVLGVDDAGMYLVASKGKPFYRQMVETGEVALSAMCPDCQSLKFLGKCRIVGKERLDAIFDDNPGLREVYPGKTRSILDVFHVYEGQGEWFDLLHHPISREAFSYGGVAEERAGFSISDNCIACGSCLPTCPQQCIEEGTPYRIVGRHCLQCGACFEICPADAVVRLHS